MATATLPRADYTDRFGTTSDTFHTAEEWARAGFEHGSLGDGDAKQRVWRRVLQLRLGRLDDRDRVAGWQVLESTEGRMVLAAESWHLTARLVFESEPGAARVTTRVTYRNLAGRLVWAAVGPVHRRAVPGILASARRRLANPRP